jgi:hypothetical protein
VSQRRREFGAADAPSDSRRQRLSTAAAATTINTAPIAAARSPLIDHHGNSTTYVAVLWC